MNARILIVEDDIHLLSGIKDILELEDYEVLTAENGLQGLKVLEENRLNPPDVIVSDIMMPEMDGFEMLEQVRKIDELVNMPFIFLTARGEKNDEYRGTLLGADVYLTKPFDANDLLIAVASRLDRSRNIQRVKEGEISDVKRKILAILNHEMRTPLTLVVAYSDMLNSFEPDHVNPDDLVMFLQGINNGAGRLRRLIENFIILVEIENGEVQKNYEQRKGQITDLESLMQDAARAVIGNEYVERCVFDLPENPPTIVADRHYLTIMLREMIDNAVKFSDANSPIEIGATCHETQCELWVRDHGRGISPENLETIWKPFQQVERDKFEDQGSGAGLAIVKGITEVHQGTCTAESELDKGSIFQVHLPVA